MKISSKNIWDVSHPAFSPDSIDVPEALRKVMVSIKMDEAEHARKPRRFVGAWRMFCSFIAVPAMAMAVFFGIKFYNASSPSIETGNMQTTTTPFGTRTTITLSDGSCVWLNSGSSLTYPVAFGRGNRIVSLTGEAFFEVESDSEHPFIVKTRNFNVKATGTAFNVNSYESDNISAVMLERGKVNVSTDEGNQCITLDPGNLLTLNESSGNVSVKEVDPYVYSSWRDGVLIFIDTPLTDVFKRLSQIYNVDFIIRDHSLASHLYKATFDGDPLSDILEIMSLSSSIGFRKSVSPIGRKTIEVYSLH